MANTIKRETAKIFPLKLVSNSEYIIQEGWNPNYVSTILGKLSRLNVIGLVVNVESPTKFSIDDGTATMEVFDFSSDFKNKEVKVGDAVLLIARIRKVNENLCLVSEIINKDQTSKSNSWFQFRKNYLDKIITYSQEHQKEELPPVVEQKPTPDEIKFETPSTNTKDELELTGDSVMAFMKKNDSISGCSIEEITSKFGEEAEDVVSTLISMGDVYEIKPGFIKVLE